MKCGGIKRKEDEGKYMKKKRIKTKRIKTSYILLSSLLCLLITVLIFMVYYTQRVKKIVESEPLDNGTFTSHYAFITDDSSDPFWNGIYQGAKQFGKSKGIYIEDFGADLSVSYTMNERVEMAIAAKVDGILMKGYDSLDIANLIERAKKEEIPVVTILKDCVLSTRCSFVGLNNYKLGTEYASEVIEHSKKEEGKVSILMHSLESENEDMILKGIENTFKESETKLTAEKVMVNSETMFTSEERIRTMIRDSKETPDFIICLNLTDTISAYQSIVDFNKVGEIQIIGYYETESILDGIEKGIITSSITINTKEMGRKAVESLLEYKRTGRVSDYITVDTLLINQEKVAFYKKELEEQKKEAEN